MQACTAMSKIGVPIYITETGVPDSRDVLRNEMFSTYFAEVRPAATPSVIPEEWIPIGPSLHQFC